MAEKKAKSKKITKPAEPLTDSQKSFLKKALAMYITNNIIDETEEEVNEYVQGMLAGDEFYYTIYCIVDEIMKEPEWVYFLKKEDIDPKSRTDKEWQAEFKEIVKDIDWQYCYVDARQEIDLLIAGLDVQIEICRVKREEEEKKKREKEEKERKKKEKEEKKKQKEEAAKKKAEEFTEAEEIKE